MSYDIKIVADSIGPNDVRIVTFQLRYPRMVHAEFMTHRAISRNASSTRAIPTAKMIEWIERDPAMPVYWGKNQKGMQATEELTPEEIEECKHHWLYASGLAIRQAKRLMSEGVHKQIASRILEPWAHINVVATATNWDNFFALRCDKLAMPEIQALAVPMARAYRDSEPEYINNGWWHLPYVSDEEIEQADYPSAELRLLKLSVARCARVSYLTMDGKPSTPESDISLHDQLKSNGHWSPFEHQARAQHDGATRSGNFVGWTQYRQTLPKSVHGRFDFGRLDEFGDRDFIT